MGCNALEFFCVPLYTNYLSNIHKKFQVTATHDINVEYHIWSFHYFFLIMMIRHVHTHKPTAKDVFFGFMEPQNV